MLVVEGQLERKVDYVGERSQLKYITVNVVRQEN